MCSFCNSTLLSLIESIGWAKEQTDIFHQVLEGSENVWYKYVVSIFRDVDYDVLKTAFGSFGLNASMFGFQKQRKNQEKYSRNIPRTILLRPCLLLDNQGALDGREEESDAYSTDLKRLPGMRLKFQGNLKTMIKHFEIASNLA